MVTSAELLLLPTRTVSPSAIANDRLTQLFHDHFDLVWRTVRRLGVDEAALDDATQEVFVVASRKLDAIEPGKEKAFLYGTAIRVAADARRARNRRRVVAQVDDELAQLEHAPSTAELIDQKRARALLDAIVARLPEDTRPVFVLYELEGLTMAEVASCLDVPPGTVASRLRRGREAFHAAVARLEAARSEADDE